MSRKIKIAVLILLIGTSLFLALTYLKKEDEIKKFDNEDYSFEYSGRYHLEKKDNYLELTEKNSNIIFEIRKLTSLENNASFESLVDNIIYNYQKESKGSQLISKYDDYKFNNGLNGYRIVFENTQENLNTLMLITLEDLNFTIITLNAYQEEFEFLTDSAELIMNTLKFKKQFEYLTLKTKYPIIQVLSLNSKGQKNLEFSSEMRSYDKNYKNYNYTVNIPTEYFPILDADGILTLKSKDETSITCGISASNFFYDAQKDFEAIHYKDKEYKVVYGYTKYNDKIYYVIKKQYKYNSETWKEEVYIYDLIDYSTTFNMQITSYNHIIDEEIEKILKNIKIQPLTEGKVKVENGEIKSSLTRIETNYNLTNLVGNNVVQVDYGFKNNNCRTNGDYDSFKTYYCSNLTINYNVVSSKYKIPAVSSMYSNYKFNFIKNITVDGNKYKYYKETYEYNSFSSLKKYENYYFVLKVTNNSNLVIKVNAPISEEQIKDLLDVKITQYTYEFD